MAEPSAGQDAPGPAQPPELPRLPPAATMGLLNYLTATSMDEDYALVARRRRAAADGRTDAGEDGAEAGGPSRGRWWVGLLVLAVFGALVATALLEAARDADEAERGRAELVEQVRGTRERLEGQRDRAEELGRTVAALELRNARTADSSVVLGTRLGTLGSLTGAVAVRGPGAVVTVDDGPGGNKAVVYDSDLQRLVNGMWLAGAEAVAVDGERLSTLSAIRLAGASVTVNFRPVSPPYRITVVGDPDTLPARLLDTPGGQWFLDLQALYGVTFTIDSRSTERPLTLPAASRLSLRHAEAMAGEEVAGEESSPDDAEGEDTGADAG